LEGLTGNKFLTGLTGNSFHVSTVFGDENVYYTFYMKKYHLYLLHDPFN